jgi:hypothetical protein
VSLSPAHAAAVWRRNASMYRRTWKSNLLPNFFEPVFYLTAIGVGVGAYISEMGGTSYAAFLAPGLVCVAAMNGASFEVTYNFFVRLNFEKAYDAMLTTPVEPDDALAGEVLWALSRAGIYGVAFYAVTVAFGYAPLPGSLLALAVIPLAALLFAAILLLHALPDTPLPVLRRLLPAGGAAVRRLAVAGRGPAARPPGAHRPGRLPGQPGSARPLGSRLPARGLRGPAVVESADRPAASDAVRGPPRRSDACGAQSRST